MASLKPELLLYVFERYLFFIFSCRYVSKIFFVLKSLKIVEKRDVAEDLFDIVFVKRADHLLQSIRLCCCGRHLDHLVVIIHK